MSLFVAEWRKQRGLVFARSMLAVVVLGGAMVIFVMAGLDAGDVISTRQSFGWLPGVQLWAGLLSGILAFVPLTFVAWGTGLEQSHDTWKMVLTRHSPRRDVLFAKLLVAGLWLVLLLASTFVVWSGLATALGWVLPVPPDPTIELSPHLYQVLGSVLRVISLAPSIMLLTLLARSNGTLVGSLTGVLAPLAVNLTALWQEPSLNRLTPVFTSDALVLRLSEAPGAAEAADRLVGASFGSLACVMVLLAWLVLPLVGAFWHFERRDVLSESE
ncbi:MAG: hypothetical protein Q8N23_20375 [Archangium sp.]|nr:hypothetical protein [Archangium sp.]MDP3155047.1 hypothetical protein [Archangium sp.]MDP3572101.1 hypothetical protein [Archangium sp.]